MEVHFLEHVEHGEGEDAALVGAEALDAVIHEDLVLESALDLVQGEPDDEVGLEGEFVLGELATHGFGRDLLQDLLLGPPQEVVFVHRPDLLRQLLASFPLLRRRFVQQSRLYRARVVVVEVLLLPQQAPLHRLEHRPQLAQVVLNRRASQNHAHSLDGKLLELLGEVGLVVFGLVALIYDHDVVRALAHIQHVCRYVAYSRDDNSIVLLHTFYLLFPIFSFFTQRHDLWRAWAPLLQLFRPIRLQSQRYHNQHPLYLFVVVQSF